MRSMDLVFLVYGAAFFFLGVAILLQPRRGSSFGLAHIFWFLAVFGLVHGVNEWLDMLKLQHELGPVVAAIGIIFLLVSYIFLFEFGRRLLLLAIPGDSPGPVSGILLHWPVYLLLSLIWVSVVLSSSDLILAMNIWSRYLFGFTGSLMTGIGFIYYFRTHVQQCTDLNLKGYFNLAAFSFILYGITSGLIVQAADYFPASVINYQSFMAVSHFPVQVLRALAAVLAALAIIKILGVFQWEVDCRLQQSLIQTRDSMAEIEKLMYRHKLVLDTAGDGIIEINQAGECTFANPAAKKIFGLDESASEADLTGSIEYINHDSKCSENILLQDALYTIQHQESRHRDDSTFMCADGSMVSVQYVVTPVIQPGAATEAVIILHDITQYKRDRNKQHQLQTQLMQMQKMECVGQLAGGIAHDFNNILSTVLGYTELAQDRCNTVVGADNKLIKYLDRVYSAGQRARELVGQMLVFSRKSSIEQDATTPVYLQPLVKELIKMMRPTLSSSVEIHHHLDEDMPLVVIDPVKLQQVLMNLCINARDAMQDVGCIDIYLTQTDVDSNFCSSCHAPINGHYVELKVQDNGWGIADDVIQRIFEPFFTTKDAGKGTGMGLAMVHGIIHESGGHILIDSVAGEGTTFRLLLPAAEPALCADRSEDVTNMTSRMKQHKNPDAHILVVDDDLEVLEYQQELLQEHGYRVTAVNSGIEALGIFNQAPQAFDLLFTDQTMPNITGTQLAHAVLTIRPDLPIILCSGFVGNISEDDIERMNMQYCFNKPVNSQDLLAAVRQLLLA